MGYMNPDVYYQPEEFGLTVVDVIEWRDEAWEFDLTSVWVDANGQLYIASDSGCSCPSPFEDYNKIDDLEKVSKFEAADILLAKIKGCEPDPEYTWRNSQANYERVQGEVVDAIAKIMKAGK